MALEISITTEGSLTEGVGGAHLTALYTLHCSVSGCAGGTLFDEDIFLEGGQSTYSATVTVYERAEPIDLDVELHVGISLPNLSPRLGLTDVDFDYFDTAAVSLGIPEEITYSSASGVFLTSVPEPRSGMPMAIGALWWLAGRRRADPASGRPGRTGDPPGRARDACGRGRSALRAAASPPTGRIESGARVQ